MIKFIDELVEKILGRKVNKGLLQFFFATLFAGGLPRFSDMSVLFVLTHFLHIFYLLAAACGFLSA